MWSSQPADYQDDELDLVDDDDPEVDLPGDLDDWVVDWSHRHATPLRLRNTKLAKVSRPGLIGYTNRRWAPRSPANKGGTGGRNH